MYADCIKGRKTKSSCGEAFAKDDIAWSAKTNAKREEAEVRDPQALTDEGSKHRRVRIASQTNENPTRMGNKLSSIRITIKGDARQVAFCLRDHMGSLDSHKLNGTVPRVGWERTPEDSLDYKVMGHVQKRAMLLKKRRATAEPSDIEFNPLEKTLYVLPMGKAATQAENALVEQALQLFQTQIWLFTRLNGVEEWGEEGLKVLGMAQEDLLRGCPEF